MQGAGNGLKQVGVLNTTNQGQAPETAPPKKLTHVQKAEMFAIRYGDDNGTAHMLTVVKIGDQWYMPPNAEVWSTQLRPLAPWLIKQLSEKVEPEAAPKKDSVDVLGAEG